jgi:ABC-2 type transport system permease protein
VSAAAGGASPELEREGFAADAANFLRVFFVGGYYAFRATFYWISPWLYIPVLVAQPIFQILFFAFIGRAANVQNDGFFVIGNAILSIAIATLFGMLFAIDGERFQQTLPALMGSPANRIALFGGRAVPVVANGVFVGAWGLFSGSLVLGVDVPGSAIPLLVLPIVVAAVSSAGLGFVIGSIGLRYRSGLVLANFGDAVFLIFCGANIPRDTLPRSMQLVGDVLPLTRSIEAARELVAGASLSAVSDLLAVEAAMGVAYGILGYWLLRYFELQGRKRATLEVS